MAELRRRLLASRRWAAAVAAIGYAAAVTSTVLAAHHVDTGYAIATQLPAFGFVTAGLIAWRARPENPLGALLMAGGVVATLWPTQAFVSVPVLFTASLLLGDLWTAVGVHFLLAFPSSRLPTRLSRVAAVAIYVYVLPFTAARGLGLDPSAEDCVDCAQAENLLFIDPPQRYHDALAVAELPLTLAVATFVAWELVRRWRSSTEARRRILRRVYIAGAGAAAGAFVREAVDGIYAKGGGDTPGIYYVADAPPIVASTVLFGILGGLVGLLYLEGMLRTRITRSTLGELVVRAGSITDSVQLRQPLARALGDPTAEVAFWAPAVGDYVDANGAVVTLPSPGGDRAVTYVEGERGPLAVLIHDPAVLEDEGLADAAGAAARLALERAQLQAELRAQLEAVRESRARIVAASDAERRRVERNIHDGAQQRLVALALDLQMLTDAAESSGSPELRAMASRAREALSEALAELRELARGLHPSVLATDGLQPALKQLASRAPVPVSIEGPPERYPEPIELAAYFVASEALANIAKYARASQAEVSVERRNGGVTIEIADDGVGGAEPQAGSGLTGLADRVAALDGTLSVESPPGRGTRVRAEFPLG